MVRNVWSRKQESLDIALLFQSVLLGQLPHLQVCFAGDWHRAVHVWIYVQSTESLLIQKRAACKESWPDLWDISAAGHGENLVLWLF